MHCVTVCVLVTRNQFEEEKNMMTMAKTPANEWVTELVICVIGDATTAVSSNNLAGTSDSVKSDLTDSMEQLASC